MTQQLRKIATDIAFTFILGLFIKAYALYTANINNTLTAIKIILIKIKKNNF